VTLNGNKKYNYNMNNKNATSMRNLIDKFLITESELTKKDSIELNELDLKSFFSAFKGDASALKLQARGLHDALSDVLIFTKYDKLQIQA
jgi:hypothetical protein